MQYRQNVPGIGIFTTQHISGKLCSQIPCLFKIASFLAHQLVQSWLHPESGT